MAKTKISEFSTTAGNNTDINSINIAEGCAPSGINDAIRELMRQLKEFQTGGAGDSVNSGGDFSVATNKFTVASASGNTAVAGTLAVTGTTTLTGALVANGNATLGDGSGDTVTVKGTPTLEVNPTLSGGTANGVLYLNGSKVATSGSALTFDGNTVRNNQSSGTNAYFRTTSGTVDAYFGAATAGLSTGVVVGSFSNNDVVFYQNSSEAMRLTSTSLYTASGINVGIGTSSPSQIVEASKSQNSDTAIQVTNSNASGSAAAQFFASNGTAKTQVFMLGTGYTTNGVLQANVGGLYSAASAGLTIAASNATGVITFATNGFNERARIDSSGNLALGTTTAGTRLVLATDDSATTGQLRFARSADVSYFWEIGRDNNLTGAFVFSNASGGAKTERARIDSDGNLLVGTTSASGAGATSGLIVTNFNGTLKNGMYVSDTNTSAGTDNAINFGRGSTLVGRLDTTLTSLTLTNLSDQRVKTNIQNSDSALDLIEFVKVRQFDWTIDNSHESFGFVAQELNEILPQAVSVGKTEEEMWGVNFVKLVPILTKAIQEQQAQIESIRKRLADAGIV